MAGLLGNVLVVLLVSLSSVAALPHCLSSGHTHDPCPYVPHGSAFDELRYLLDDAVTKDHRKEFVVRTLMEMFKYTYPCATDAEAALYTFIPNSNHLVPTHDWLQHWNDYFSNHLTAFSAADDKYIMDLFKHIEEQNNHNCVIRIWHYVTGNGGRNAFHSLYGDFAPPEQPTTTPTTMHTTPPTTTTTTTTTTPMPTTTTTPMPTTTTTTPAPTTMPSPPTCTDCTGLACLLHVSLVQCTGQQRYCHITVRDTGSGRDVTRGCADDTVCPPNTPNDAACQNLDQQLSSTDTTCIFCCQTDNCNRPPFLYPNHQ